VKGNEPESVPGTYRGYGAGGQLRGGRQADGREPAGLFSRGLEQRDRRRHPRSRLALAITVATIWLIPIVEEAFGWRWAFAFLAPGPALGILFMLRLLFLPGARRIAGGRG